MALRVVTVKASGGDYTSLNAAFAGEVGDLVGLNRQLEIDCSTFTDTIEASTGSWTTDSTHTVLITAVDNHYGLVGTAYSLITSGDSLTGGIDYATYRGLAIQSTGANGTNALGGTGFRFERCIVIGQGVGGFVGLWVTGDQVHIENTIAVCPDSDGFAAVNGSAFLGTVLSLYNCTAIGKVGFLTAFSATTAKNCVASGSGDGFVATGDGAWTASSVTCSSDDATIPTAGTGHRTNQTFTFVSAGNYHLATTDTGAKGFGTNLSTDGSFPLTTDIDSATRTDPWDIGADQYAFTPATNDVLLRGVPSDTNPNDVRLYPPFVVDTAVTLAIGSTTEAGSDASLTERISAAVATATEQASAVVLDERYVFAITTAAEAASAATVVERINAGQPITTRAEQYSNATLVNTPPAATSLAITTVTEAASSATLTERITASVATQAEQFSDAVGSVRSVVAVATSTEAFSDAAFSTAVAGPVTLNVATTAEQFSDAVLVVPIPVEIQGHSGQFVDRYPHIPQKLTVRAVAEAPVVSSDAVMGVSFPRITMAVRTTTSVTGQAFLTERLAIQARTTNLSVGSDSQFTVSDDNIVFAWSDALDGDDDLEDLLMLEMV